MCQTAPGPILINKLLQAVRHSGVFRIGAEEPAAAYAYRYVRNSERDRTTLMPAPPLLTAHPFFVLIFIWY